MILILIPATLILFWHFGDRKYYLCSLLLIIYSLVQYFSGHAVEGYTTTLLVLLLIGSAIMLSLGIIGYYIAKIYEEVKRRPRYIVSRIMRGGEDVSETARHDGR